jgi:hypothetical protein
MSAKPARQTRVTSELAWLLVTTSVEGAVFVPNRYPEEFRRKVPDLVAAGGPIAQVAADLAISDQTIDELAQRSQDADPDPETEEAILKRAVSCCGSRTAQRRYGHSHHGRRRTARATGVPATGGGRLGLTGGVRGHRRTSRHAWLSDQIRGVPTMACNSRNEPSPNAPRSGPVPSMAPMGDCYDCVVIEPFWDRMQTKLLNRKTMEHANQAGQRYHRLLEIFPNGQRRHSPLGMRRPIMRTQIEFELIHQPSQPVA